MALLGLDMVGADEGGLLGAAPDWLKKAGAAVIPAAADAASKALDDKPKDGDKSKDAAKADKPKDDESFFTKAIVGPVKVWHAMLAGVAAGGLAWWKLRK